AIEVRRVGINLIRAIPYKILEHHLKIAKQCREFFWVIASALDEMLPSLVGLAHPPDDRVGINDSSSFDLRVERVVLVMANRDEFVLLKVIANKGCLTHNCAFTTGRERFNI